MSVDIEAEVARSAERIDAMLTSRWDALALQMIADGADPNGTVDVPADPESGWQLASFNDVLAWQRQSDLEWRAETLRELRAWVETLSDPLSTQ